MNVVEMQILRPVDVIQTLDTIKNYHMKQKVYLAHRGQNEMF